jgi:predicted nucleic acid-binding protein
MRIVVDTNVFISAALKESSWPGAVIRWLDRFGGVLKTAVSEQEVFEVLQWPRIADDVVPLHGVRLRRIFAAAELVTITERVTGCRDPNPDPTCSCGQIVLHSTGGWRQSDGRCDRASNRHAL